MPQRFIVFTWFLVALSDFVFSQKYSFVNYTPKDGLVNSRVRKAYQDSKGRMYFVTYGGLSVYDGARFRNYTGENGLSSNLVNDILEVGNDSLLVAVNANNVYTLVNGILEPLKLKNNFCPLVNQFLKSEDGFVYASSDNGLFRLNKEGFEKLSLNLPDNKTNFLFLGSIVEFHHYFIFTTNDFKNNTGLYIYDKDSNQITDAQENSRISFIGKDRSNRFWIGLSGKILMLDSVYLEKGKLKFNLPPVTFTNLKSFSAAQLGFDDQNVWINRDAKEIIRINNSSSVPEKIVMLQAEAMGSIFIDKEHNVWICDDGAGVYKLMSAGLQINEHPFETTIITASIFPDTCWFGSRGNKIFRSTNSGSKTYSTNISQSPFIIHQSANKLWAEDVKNIYEADYPAKNQNKIFFRRKMTYAGTGTLGRKCIIDQNSNFIGSVTEGLIVWKDSTLFFKYTLQPSDFVEGLQLDKSGRLWMATRLSGLTVFSLHPENPSHYLQPLFLFPQLEGDIYPRSMLLDKNGLIWVGGRDHGLIVFELKGKKLIKRFQFRINNGLSDDFVTSLAVDTANNIIVGTQTGLDRIIRSKDEYFVENTTKSNNFFSYINQVWSHTDNSANALTGNGMLIQAFAPVLKTKNDSPLLFIEELRLNGEKSSIQKRRLQYAENNLAFSLAAPTFIAEKLIRYTYHLEGDGNNRWSDTSINPEINLVNLRPENYKLFIKAFFPSTPYPPQELVYEFSISPPWWQTWWFRLLSVLTGIAIFVLLVRSYFRRKLLAQRILLENKQAVEKERTRIATDMHDDLGSGLSRIYFLSEIIRRKKKDDLAIQPELSKISSFSHEMIDKMGEIVWALNEKNDTIADLLAFTRSYAADYLENHNIECRIEAPEELPQLYIKGETRRNIFLSVKECLFNIVKHASATSVDIRFQLDKEFKISIHDNGMGIDWEKIRANGNGLANIRKRMNELEGSASFTNNHGTEVSMIIPLYKV